MKRSLLKGALLGATMLVGIAGAQAAPTTALYLAMDGSGSIDGGQFTTQISGYSAALNAFFAANPAAFGKVAIGGNIFGSNVIEFAPLAVINNAGDLATLTTAINGLDPGRAGIGTGATAIGDAINAATAALLAFEVLQATDLKLIIDVTTDGVNNTGANPTTAAGNAILASVNAVNCLGIGGGASCAFVAGSGTDFGTVSFANLGIALANKLQVEVIGVPEPMTLAIFGLGLAGLGLARRRA